jgi:hypothetical protein
MSGVLTIVGTLGSLAAGTSGVIIGISTTVAISAAVLWYSREIALWLFQAKEVKPEEKQEALIWKIWLENFAN